MVGFSISWRNSALQNANTRARWFSSPPPMAKFLDLPIEIRLLIAQNLSKNELFRVRFLNSLFFNHWMDTNWRCVSFTHLDRQSVRCLQRAVDPFVATRLRHLCICRRPAASKLQKTDSQTFDSLLLHHLPLLVNITSLSIQLFKNVSSTNFFVTITSLPVARKLQDLSLTGPLDIFDWLWEYSAHNTPFPNLTKLDLHLYDPKKENNSESSLRLKHFLHSLAPTLQYLRIRTKIDLSPLFHALLQPLSESDSIFLNLKSLILRLHFNYSFQSSPQSLRRFLYTHTDLHLLHLDLMTTHIQSDGGSAGPLDAWLADLVANENYQLPSLQTLNVYPSDTPAGFSPLLPFIKRTAPTLTSLKVSHRHLTDKEAQQLLDAVTEGKAQVRSEEPRKLKSLMMAVDFLTVPFFDLLASKFPELEQLTLWASDTDQKSFYDLPCHRRYNPNVADTRDVLHAWKLNELEIQSSDWNPVASKHVQEAVARTVPALARELEARERFHWRFQL